MPQATLQAWLSLYAAVGVMVALCAVLAMIKTAYDYRLGTRKLPTATSSIRYSLHPGCGYVGRSTICSARRRSSELRSITRTTSGSILL